MNRVLNLVNKPKSEDNIKNDPLFEMVKQHTSKVSLSEIENKLTELGVDYEVKNPNHIKLGPINYYVSTGSIYIDGMGAKLKKKGFSTLKQLLKRWGFI